MKIKILVFGSPGKLTKTTQTDVDMLQKSAEDLGHDFEVLYSRQCQLKINGTSSMTVAGKKRKIPRLLVRANFLHKDMDLHASVIRHFELSGTFTMNHASAIHCAKNKVQMMQHLSQAGVPIPKTYVLRNVKNIDDVVKDLGNYPIIMKTGTGSHGAGVSIVESKRSLKSMVDMLVGPQKESFMLLQEYIKESKGKDIRCFVVGDKVVAAMERSAGKKGEFRSNFHLGGKVASVKLTRKEKTLALKSARACGLDFAGVDILRSDRGPLALEVNANPGLEGITTATGIDVAGEIIKYFVSESKKFSKKTKDKKPIIGVNRLLSYVGLGKR